MTHACLVTCCLLCAPTAELFDRRYDGKDQEMSPIDVTISSDVVSKSFGTAMAGICFVDFIFPELASDTHSVAASVT